MRLLPWLRLLRVGALFSPAADVVAGMALAGAAWDAAAARTILASMCLYAAGMVWNDYADREADATTRPERPLPSGQIRPAMAAALGGALLAGCLLLTPLPWWHGPMAALVLAYDFALKRSPVLGALVMGSLRALNLMVGAALLWPWSALPEPVRLDIWIAAGAYFVYIVAVTLLGILEDAPNVKPRAVVSLQSAPLLASLLALFAVQGGPWPAPAIAAVFLLAFGARNRRVADWNQRSIRGSMTWLLLGTLLYTALLCVAKERYGEALAIAAAVLPARWISRRISLT